MAIQIITTDPHGLLRDLYLAIDGGHIDTWSYDKDKDFTHTPPQWKHHAWLRPQVLEGTLLFGIIGREGVKLSVEDYAIYHGRFIEMLLAHFDKRFSFASSTALLVPPDLYKPAPTV